MTLAVNSSTLPGRVTAYWPREREM